jgi:hypothetical protein
MREFKEIILNIKRVTSLGYEIAGGIVIWYYATAFFGGLAPFLASYLLKLLIDAVSGTMRLSMFDNQSLSAYLMIILGSLVVVRYAAFGGL